MKSHVFVPWVIMSPNRVRMDGDGRLKLNHLQKSFILVMAANHSFVGRIKSSDGTS